MIDLAANNGSLIKTKALNKNAMMIVTLTITMAFAYYTTMPLIALTWA